MKVMLLTRYTRMGASSRLRTLQYVEALRGYGVECHVFSLLDDAYLQAIYQDRRLPVLHVMRAYLRRLSTLLKAGKYDVLWIEKELFPNCPSLFEWLLHKARVPYVVDYDDAVFHNYGLSRNPLKRLLANKIGKVMRHAAMVVAGNHYLLHHATLAGAARVTFLPTVLDIRRYRPALRQRGEGEQLLIGWIGSPSTAKYLRPLLPVLARLARMFPIALVVVGAKPDAAGYGFIRHVPWSEATEAAEIARFDIGIMPLSDGPWERGKCGYKLIQYMACGKPVIASPVGVNVDIVDHGVNGMLASTPEEWFDAFCRLLSSGALRHDMGRKGRALAETRYSLQAAAPRLLHLLESVALENRKCRHAA